MSSHENQFREDKAVRDAARALLDADVARVKAELDSRSIGERALDRARDGAAEVFDKASDSADSNRGVLALLVGALVLWFARNPILALFFDEAEVDELTDETGSADPHGDTSPMEKPNDL